jgi:predicted porin
MQKKIIALAIAAAFSAPAFADVTAYGVLDAAIAHVSGSGQNSGLQAVAGGLATSRFGVKTAEDIGDLKAVGVLEYALDNEVNTTVGVTSAGVLKARQQLLAVAGGFGTVATGYLQTTGYDWAVKFDPTAGSTVSPLQDLNAANFLVGSTAIAARAPRALAYISPDLGGVTVAVNYTTEFTGGLGDVGQASGAQNKVTAYLVSATYNGGPLSVGGVYAKDSIEAGSAGEKTDFALGVSYDLTVVKLFATYQSDKTTGSPATAAVAGVPFVVDPATGKITGTAAVAAQPATGDVTRKAESVSVVAPVGPGAVVFTYAKTSGVSNEGASGETVAWLQGLSKQTTLYAALSKISQDSGSRSYSVFNNGVANANLDLGGSSTLLAVGLNKKF